jgi:hypothetical protein
MSMLRAVVALSMIVSFGVQAIKLRKYPPNVYYDKTTEPPTLFTKIFVDVTCSPADWAPTSMPYNFTVASESDPATSYVVSVACAPPTYVYETPTVGYVPADGYEEQSKFCRQVDNTPILTSYLNATSPEALLAGANATRQAKHSAKLKGAEQRVPGRVSFYEARRARHLREARLANGHGHSQPGLSFVFPVITLIQSTLSAAGVSCKALKVGGDGGKFLGTLTGATGCGADDDTLNKLKDLNARLDAGQKELAQTAEWMNGNVSNLNNVTAKLWLDQLRIENETAAVDLHLQGQIDAQANSSLVLLGMFNASSQKLDAFITATKANQASTAAESARLASDIGNLANATAMSLGTLLGRISNLTNYTNSRLLTMEDNTAAEKRITLMRAITTNRVIRSLTGDLKRSAERHQDRRVHTRALRAALLRVAAQGCIAGSPSNCSFLPYVRNTGTASRLTNPGSFYFEVETLFIRSLVPGGNGQVYAYEDMFEIKCSANAVIDSMHDWETATDFLLALGPTNCDPSSASAYCYCYIRRQITSCVAPAALSGGGATSYADPASQWNNAGYAFGDVVELGGVGALSKQFCANSGQGANAPAVTSSPTITTGSALADTFTVMLTRAPIVGGVYVITSRRALKKYTVRYDAAVGPTITTMDLSINTYPVSLPSIFMLLAQVAQGSFASLAGEMARFVDGTLMDGISVYDQPLSVTSGGATAMCSRTAFMAYSTTMLPVKRLLLRSEGTAASVRITTVVDGRATGTTTIPLAEIVTNNPLQAILPNDLLFVGSATHDPSGLVYDTAQTDISVSPDANARRNRISYVLCPTNKLCTVDEWSEASAGAAFDADSGTTVANMYARPVVLDSTTGAYRCDDNPSLAPTSMCELRRRYNFLDGPSPGTLYLQSVTEGSYVLNFAVPAGVISESIVSSCPMLVVSWQPSGGATLTFTNNRPAPVLLSIAWVVCDECLPPGLESITVPASGSATAWIETQDTDMFMTATNAISGATCPGLTGIDVRGPSRNVLVFERGMVDQRYTHAVSAVAVDAVSLSLQRVHIGLSAAIQDLTLLVLDVVRNGGIVLTDTTPENWTLPFYSIMNRTAQSAVVFEAIRNNATVSNYSMYDDIVAANTGQFEAARQLAAAERNLTIQHMDARRDLLEVQARNLADYNDARVSVDRANDLFARSLNNFTAMQVQFNALGIQALMSLDTGSGGGLGLGDIVGDLVRAGGALGDAVKDVAREAVDVVKDVAREAKDLAKEAVDAAKGFLPWPMSGGSIKDSLMLFLYVILIGGALYFAWKSGLIKQCMSKSSSTERRTTKRSYAPVSGETSGSDIA